jgi:hypothetical protein
LYPPGFVSTARNRKTCSVEPSPAQLDLTINDRFGSPVRPREWFPVPIAAIDEAVQRIREGSITDVIYDPEKARLKDAG